MSRTFHHGERRIRVRGIQRDPKDLRRLARALIELAQIEAQAEAQARQNKQTRNKKPARLRGHDKGASETEAA